MSSSIDAASSSSAEDADASILELHQKYEMEVQNLTLATQTFRTLRFFAFALFTYLKQLLLYVFRYGGWLVLFSIFLGAFGLLLLAVDGSQEHFQEFVNYFRYAFWWVALGVASSIGLGAPLFVLAGIMCGQFGVTFLKFFLASLFKKAIFKTHIQSFFIISLCNNQRLEWVENELIWVFSSVPVLSSVLPAIVTN